MRDINPAASLPRPVVNSQPYVRPPSLAIIPHTPHVPAWEFVKAEITRRVAAEAIQEVIQRELSYEERIYEFSCLLDQAGPMADTLLP